MTSEEEITLDPLFSDGEEKSDQQTWQREM